jgi:hypothetical protein
LECVSGLSQQAVLIDVAAKVLADNLASLMCIAYASGHGILNPNGWHRRLVST